MINIWKASRFINSSEGNKDHPENNGNDLGQNRVGSVGLFPSLSSTIARAVQHPALCRIWGFVINLGKTY
jgi:hypothetical protein